MAQRPASTNFGAASEKPGRQRQSLDPDIIAAEIVEDLEAALQQFAAIANDLKK